MSERFQLENFIIAYLKVVLNLPIVKRINMRFIFSPIYFMNLTVINGEFMKYLRKALFIRGVKLQSTWDRRPNSSRSHWHNP